MAAVVKIFTAALSLSDLVKSSKDFSLLSFLLEAYLIPVVAKIYAGTPIIPPANAVTGASIPFKAPVAKFFKLAFLLALRAFFFSAFSSFLSVNAFLSTLNSLEPILSILPYIHFVIPPATASKGSITSIVLDFDFIIFSA